MTDESKIEQLKKILFKAKFIYEQESDSSFNTKRGFDIKLHKNDSIIENAMMFDNLKQAIDVISSISQLINPSLIELKIIELAKEQRINLSDKILIEFLLT
jgi:hypothetical protein